MPTDPLDDLPDDPDRPSAEQADRFEAMIARLAIGNLRQWTSDDVAAEFDLLRLEIHDVADSLEATGELPLFLQQLAVHIGSLYVRLAEETGLPRSDAIHLVRRPMR